MTTIDATDATFERDVIERSNDLPVVVDFWAAWCGPCRALTPILESAADQRSDDVVLAKVDTDANPEIARRYDIRGIPAVKAFRNGDVVDEFVGVQPPAAVDRFFDRLVPSEADRLVDGGDEQSLRRALELQPGRADAALALARILLERGDAEGARELLDNVVGDYQAEGLAARLRLQDEAPPTIADTLRQAFAALDDGQLERGIELLLSTLATADGSRDDVRRVIVGALDTLAPGDPLAREVRRRLAAALY